MWKNSHPLPGAGVKETTQNLLLSFFVYLVPFWREGPRANRNTSVVLMGCLVLKYEDVSFLSRYSQNKPPS